MVTKIPAVIFLLLSLSILGVTLWIGHGFLNGNSILILGYIASFVCSILSLIFGVKNFMINDSRKIINIVTMVAAAAITAFYLFFIIVVVMQYFSDLPVNP